MCEQIYALSREVSWVKLVPRDVLAELSSSKGNSSGSSHLLLIAQKHNSFTAGINNIAYIHR